MCGILGIFVSKEGQLSRGSSRKYVEDLFLISEDRGREASGVAVKSERGVIVEKSPLSASQFIKTSKFKS